MSLSGRYLPDVVGRCFCTCWACAGPQFMIVAILDLLVHALYMLVGNFASPRLLRPALDSVDRLGWAEILEQCDID